MKNLSQISLILMVSLGCAAKIQVDPNVNRQMFSVQDHRSPEQKASRRDSALSAVAVLGDKNVQPNPIDLLESAIQKAQQQPEKTEIIIDDLAVIDYFPHRLKSATHSGGWLTDTIVRGLIQSKTDWELAEKVGLSKDDDSILCVFSGKVNGVSVKTIQYSSYKISPFVVSVRGSKEFQDAILNAMDKVAKESMIQVKATH